MKKHLAPLLALLFAAAAVLSACVRADDGHLTLTLMGKKSDLEKSYMTDIFARYEAQTGNRLELVAIEDSDYENAVAERLDGGKAPDILLHFHNADLARFDVENNFLYLNGQPWADDLTESARAYCLDRNGNLLGLPFWESSVSGCYYNKTILDSLGLRPAATQAEFDMLCQVLADAGYTPICWPADGCTWMFQFGLDPVFADDPALLERLNAGDVSYAGIPAVADMVQWVAGAAEKGWFGTDYLNTGWGDISTALGSGEAVMTFIWDTWFYTDLAPGQAYDVADFALMPVFMGTADGGTYEGGNLNMMMVNKNSAHTDEALAFLQFCATPENYNAAFDGIATVSCFRGQTTNIESPMVSAAAASIRAHERVSTAASRIVGYSADDVADAFAALLRGRTDVAGCVAMMDAARLREAGLEGGTV